MRFNNLFIILIALLFTFCESESGDSSGIGQGGSMTRFAIQNNFLYIVDNHTIKVFDISENNFVQLNEVTVGFGLETIFARAEYLYLGANDAMYIYSLEDPALPRFIFRYAHIVACDPVVVQGNRAYITLRSADDNSFCNRGINALEIIDITDPNQPKLLASYPMQSPHGLAVDGDYLFLCEGTGGLKFIDISNELDIKTLQHIEDIDAYDVIARNGLLILTGEDGIFQFSYSEDAEELQLISKLPVSREVL
ncbi:MAG TPA: hypothetical protein PKC24_10960 [Cyclobacteriaceae bacterium]|nr:hypothetical protein [Cyclobacteriaceae bacterium]